MAVASREKYKKYWKAAYSITAPERGQKFDLHIHDNAFIYDTTAKEGVRLFASSLVTGLTPASTVWSRPVPSEGTEASDETKEWLESVGDTVFEKLTESNFNSVILEFFKDITIAGMAGLFIWYSDDLRKLVFETWRIEDLYVMSEGGISVDTIYRTVDMTIAQVISRFGEKNLPKALRSVMEGKDFDPTETYEILHVIKPRKNSNPGGLSKNLPIASVYIYPESKELIQESGYEEMAAVVPRWLLLPDSEYALGVLHDAIAPAKSLNQLQYLLLDNVDMQVNPPFILADDGVLNVDTIQIESGSVVMAKEAGNMRQLVSQTNLPYAINLIGDLRQQVQSVLMTQQLLPTDKANATATEVRTRTLLIRKILSPIYSRLENELLSPMMTRIIGLLARNGELPVMSDTVAAELIVDGSISFSTKFDNANTRANQLELLSQQEQFEGSLGGIAQLNPEVLDNYDFDKATISKARKLGVSENLIRSTDEVLKIREERENARQEAIAQEQAANAKPTG